VKDLNTAAMVAMYVYDNDRFLAMIEESYQYLVSFTSGRIAEHVRATNENPSIEVLSLSLGGKGFNVNLKVEGQYLEARAIPVEGAFVSFHYRYLVN
jgi:hypothetical protein